MLLRESGKQTGEEFDLNAVIEGGARVGIPFETELLKLTRAVCTGDATELSQVRAEVEAILGAQKTCDAIGVAAAFNGITKIANATGLHLDPATEAQTIDMRRDTGIDAYSEQAKSVTFDG